MADELTEALRAANEKISSFPELAVQQKKVLIALMTHAPGIPQRLNMCREIASCTNAAALGALAKLYSDSLIMNFRTTGAQTPKVSDHPSRQSFDENASALADQAQTPYRQQGPLRRIILERDGHRCVITGRSDMTQEDDHPDGYTDLVAAHIIPFSIGVAGGSLPEREGVGQVWAILERYGGIHLAELNGIAINRPENVFTLGGDAHGSFGKLRVWLEPQENQPHTYRFRKSNPGLLKRLPDGSLITFSAQSTCPLPDRRYLALHAACAKVMHEAGLAQVIEKLLQDYEDLTVLSSDGSSAELLTHALNMVSVC